MHNFLFGIYPYIALSVLLIGSVVRYERDPFTWKSSSSQMLRRKQLIIGSILFHVGVLVIFVGHLVGLLTPIAIFDAIGISHGAKQLLAVIAGGIAGVMALVGGGMLMHRRWTDPRIRKTSSFADIAILALLLAQLVLGLGTVFVSLQHLDGHEMTKFMSWAQGIFTFRSGAAAQIEDVALIFKLHLFLGLTIFLVFPFTRLVHIASGIFAPLRYLFLRAGYQLVRSRRHRPLEERRRAYDKVQAKRGPSATTPAE
ncbi:respiratory nitrate reductase subunit gamma [Actibacterium ureilyticum]|uniref:respiratory nitrate reductase subunit gamma n=1 Tax=Actibacterium ureilyticum TaxID=1590614 RepID=UPI0015958862|nr:respiratory nitrate reductase subunit gamma [Actibacterium ureilyticum]